MIDVDLWLRHLPVMRVFWAACAVIVIVLAIRNFGPK